MLTGDGSGLDRAEQLYADLLADVAERIDAAARFLQVPAWPTVRAAAGELRGVLELLVLSGLLTHVSVLTTAQSALVRADKTEARRLVRAANSRWWPSPIIEKHVPGQPIEWLPRANQDWLKEGEWDSYHSRTSNLLHARNPFVANERSIDASVQMLSDLVSKLSALLTKHTIAVTDDYLLLGQIGPPEQVPRVRVNRFAAVRN